MGIDLHNKTAPHEINYINWGVQHLFNSTAIRELVTANFQDVYNMTRRAGEVEVKMNRLKFRAQGIGGTLGIAAGALGGPLGGVIGFGIGRALGSYVGNFLAKRYYGEEQATVNEHLFLARQRDSQLKYQLGIYNSLGSMISTFQKGRIQDDKKLFQDMIVL